MNIWKKNKKIYGISVPHLSLVVKKIMASLLDFGARETFSFYPKFYKLVDFS